MKSRAHGTGELARGAETRRRKSQLGHLAGARFDFPQTILSPDDAPGKEARRHCCRPALLAVVWQVLQKGIPYAEPSNEVFQQREHSKKVRHHLRKLKELGVDITPSELSPLPEFLKTQPAFTRPLGALGIHAP
jgi:hypothetical protein